MASTAPPVWTVERLENACKTWSLREFDLWVVNGDDGEPWEMHKGILESASPIFNNLLEDVIALDGIYTLELDIERPLMEIIRNFLYDERLPRKLDLDMTLQIMEISFRYAIVGLYPAAVAHVKSLITPEAAFQVLQRAREVECNELQDQALEIIIRNADVLVNSKEFLTLGCHDVCRILCSDDLSWREVDIFDAAYKWAQNQLPPRKKYSSKVFNNYLAAVIKCIRFPIMTSSELATIAQKDIVGALKPRELIRLFQHAALPDVELITIPSQFLNRPRNFALQSSTCVDTKVPDATGCLDKQNVQSPTITTAAPEAGPSIIPPPSPHFPLASLTTTPTARKRSSSDSESLETVQSATTTTMEITSSKVPRLETQQEEDDELFDCVRIVNIEGKEFPNYEVLIRRYLLDKKKQDIFVKISNVDLQSNYLTLKRQKCTGLHVDVRCNSSFKDKSSLQRFVSHFDPMRYVLAGPAEEGVSGDENEIWPMDRNLLLKFNGVTFIQVQHARTADSGKDLLVINYIRESLKVLAHPQIRPSELAVSNCEFSIMPLEARGENLVKLVLYRVWGNFTLQEIVESFPKLKELMLWKCVPLIWIYKEFVTPLRLDFTQKLANIRKLTLFETELIFPERNSNFVKTRVTQLVLDHCDSVASKKRIGDLFHLVFPRLKKLVITEERVDNPVILRPGRLATSSLINSVRKNIGTIELIMVEGMKWDGLPKEDNDLSEFLRQINNDEECTPDNYELQKTEKGKWNYRDLGEPATEEDNESDDNSSKYNRDDLEFDWWNLSNFYDSTEVFEDYFLQSEDDFPSPILWI